MRGVSVFFDGLTENKETPESKFRPTFIALHHLTGVIICTYCIISYEKYLSQSGRITVYEYGGNYVLFGLLINYLLNHRF